MNPIRLSDYEIRTSGRQCYNNHVSLLSFTSLKKEADFDKTIIIKKSNLKVSKELTPQTRLNMIGWTLRTQTATPQRRALVHAVT